MLHPTFLITPEQRIAADETQRIAETNRIDFLARAIRLARQAESFPNSYTSTAVELSERIIRAAAAMQPVQLCELARELTAVQERGEWYR